MAQLSTSLTLPRSPEGPDKVPMSPELRAWLSGVMQWGRDLSRQLEGNGGAVHQGLNELQAVGDDIASAASITLSARIHHVTGTSVISTISAEPSFSGLAYLIADATWTLATGDNIARASAPVVGQVVGILFDPKTALWYVM